MEPFVVILAIALSILLAIETWSYGRYLQNVNNLQTLADNFNKAFQAAVDDIVNFNTRLTEANSRIGNLEHDIVIMQTLLEIQRDAIGLSNRINQIENFKVEYKPDE